MKLWSKKEGKIIKNLMVKKKLMLKKEVNKILIINNKVN
jgi:hypothetical protein